MPLQTYTVAYSTNGSDFTDLTNVQNIVINLGRNAQLDQIKTSVASFEMRYPTGYASPIAALVSGTFIRIRNTTGTPYDLWFGKINNVTAQYGIPFAGGVGQADFLSVSCEGPFADLGRMQGEGYAMAADTITNQITAANLQTGVPIGQNFVPTSSLAATTVSGTWGDWSARVCQSTNSRMWDSVGVKKFFIVSPFFSNVSTINFSDVANDSTNQVYNQINFDSLADNFYTQVTVTPESFGAATVTESGATTPYRTYQTNTLNASTAQATDFANYLLGNYGTAQFAISSFTCMAEAQSSFQLDKIGYLALLTRAPGTQVAVTFRGTTFQCIIEGVTMSATPAGASFTYYVSGADLNSYLILDNATFGKLDSNRLAY
jgi:hypothetical protein